MMPTLTCCGGVWFLSVVGADVELQLKEQCLGWTDGHSFSGTNYPAPSI